MRRAIALVAILAACRGPAERREPPAAIVSASATPSAPTVLASADVVTNASKHDAGPSVIAADKIDGAALRKRHVARLTSDTSPVTVLAGGGPLELGRRLCEAVVPKRPPETPILLKPNLCGYDRALDPKKHGGDDGVRGRTTDVEFVRGVVRCLKARGQLRITVADGCSIPHGDFVELVARDGYQAMAAEEQVGLAAMDDDGVFDVEGDQPGKPLAVTGIGKTHVPSLLLPKLLAETLDHGLFVSIPKIKAHRFAVVSLAIKGMQGTVMYSDRAPAYRQKWRSHKELVDYLDQKKEGEDDRPLYVASLKAFAERMVDVLEIATPDVVLAEGAPAMSGDGFHLLVPSAENLAIGGTNPVLVDRVGAELLGLWDNAALARELGGHRTSPLIEIAARRYHIDLAAVALTGDGAELLARPRPVHYKALAPFRIDWEPADAKAKPEAHAAPLGTDEIAIDGAADAAWSRAAPVTWDSDYAGRASGIATRARFLWSPRGLYLLFELEGAGLAVDRARPVDRERVGLFQEDCVELFLAPSPKRIEHYYEVEIGPYGHFFDLAIDREHHREDTSWASGATIAARQDPARHTATIEALLGAREIAEALRAGARLPLGLYRMEGKDPRHYLAWSPPRTAKPDFHVPKAFGVLVLDP